MNITQITPAEQNDPALINNYNTVSNQNSVSGEYYLGWQTSRIYNSRHLSPLSTIGSTTTGNHRTSSLMSLNPLAPAFLPSYQSSSNSPISLCNSTTMGLPWAQLICGMPPQTIPSLAPSNYQHIADTTLLLPHPQQTHQSTPDAASHQPTPGSLAPLPSSLQYQSNCLQAINKTIKQFSQDLKAEQLDRQTLQLIFLQLQNDFALLRYLLFSPVETTFNANITVEDSATSPLFTPKANPKPNPASAALRCPGPGELKLYRSTPVGAVGPPRTKTNNTTNANPNSQEASSTTVQNLASRICKLEKLFADELSAYTSITAGIHSQYFFLYDKLRQLEPGHSDIIIWKIPSVKFVFDSAKVARPSSDPLIDPATSFSSPFFRTHPHGYNFFIKLYPYGIGPATGKCASILFTLFPGYYDNLLQWPFTKIIHFSNRDQLDPMNTWMNTIRPDQDPAHKKPTMTTKTGVATILINNFIPHSKLFSETEGFLTDGASFIEIKFSDPPVLKPHTQASLLFPFP